MLSSLPFSPAMPATAAPAPPAAGGGPADGAASGGFSQALDEAKAPAPERAAASRGRGNGAAGGPDKAPRTLPGKPEFSSLPDAEDLSALKSGTARAAAAEEQPADEQVNDLLAQLQSQAQLQLLTPQGAAVGARGPRGASAAAVSGTPAARGDDGTAASGVGLSGTPGAAGSRLAGAQDGLGAGANGGSDARNQRPTPTSQLQNLGAQAAVEQALLAEPLPTAAASVSTAPGQPLAESRSITTDGVAALNALATGAALAAAPGSSAAAPAEARLPARPGSADFAPQLGTQLSTFVRDGIEHARLHLNPAEMGPVSVRIQLDGQTAMVHLSADNAQTRQALEQSMPQLASQLREAGLTLTGGGVSEQPRQDNPATADGPGGRGDGRSPGRDGRGLDDRTPDDVALASTRAPQRRGVVDLVA